MSIQRVFAAAPLDSYAERVTTGLAYLGGLLLLPLLFAYLSNLRWGGLLIPTALALLLALFLLLAYAVQPVHYRIETQHLVIKRRLLPALRLPLKTITGVSLASMLADIPRRGVRFAFNPGVYGYQGPFYLAPFGKTFFLATNREKLVSLGRSPADPLVISPHQPRAFMQALSQALEDVRERSATTPDSTGPTDPSGPPDSPV